MKINPDCKVCKEEMVRLQNGYTFCLSCKIKKVKEKYEQTNEQKRPQKTTRDSKFSKRK